MFKSYLSQGLAPRVLRLMLKGIATFRGYAVQFEKDATAERCFVLYWEDDYLEEVCVGCEVLNQVMPKAELVPLAQVVNSLESRQLPLAILEGSQSLLCVLRDSRDDGWVFVAYQTFNDNVLARCIRQAYQDVFSMVEVTTPVEYTAHCLKTTVYEEWTERRNVLRKCARQGFVDFTDLRQVLSDLIELLPSIRPYKRCTGNLESKDKTEMVICVFDIHCLL